MMPQRLIERLLLVYVVFTTSLCAVSTMVGLDCLVSWMIGVLAAEPMPLRLLLSSLCSSLGLLLVYAASIL